MRTWTTSGSPWLACLWFVAGAGAQAPRALDYPALLARLTDVRWLCTPPAAGERCVQFSSYDRRSDKGPANAEDWYANDDRGQYLRVEERDGSKEYVMADIDGPGCIARIWSANPSGVLHFDIDGQRAWTVDFAALLSGKVEPVGEPLAGVHSRGANCYLPIPFQEHLKVTASKNDFYYHVNVVRFAYGTRVPSFTPALLQEHAAAITVAVNGLPGPTYPHIAVRCETPGSPVEVPAGGSVEQLRFRPRDLKGDLGERLRHLLLVVRCGREETVRVPVGDFFCGAPDWKPHAGFLLGIHDWTGYCNFPMPMPTGGSVAIEAEGTAETLPFTLDVARDVGVIRADSLLFHANWHLSRNLATRPFHDHLVLDANGRGRFVGTSLLVKNPVRAWWGEGDEKFFVDGESFPSTFGTGTEDYFGYAWCCNEPFSSAFHAQPQCDGPGNFGFTAVNRMHVLDSVSFAQSFRFDLEVWHWVDCKVDYATVAYWYGAPGATAGLPPVPPAAQRTLDRLPPPRVFAVAGALEGEALRVLSCSGGRHEVQDMSFKEAIFSKDAQRWWMDGKPGDALVLAVPVAAAGRYRVRAAFCMADDYGIVQCSLAGSKLGGVLDCYAPAVATSGARVLGEVDLQPGDAELRLELTGRNDKSKPRFMVGLDYLMLEKLQ